jgi:anaerobic magnesium-protoporphyrin IX monomethyl ester cyclase
MHLKVQLLHPPAFLNPTALTALRPSLPLGLAYIAAAIREAGFDVGVCDAVGEAPDRIVREGRIARLGLSPAEMIERIAPETQVVGLSVMFTYQWPLVKELTDAIKAKRPDLLIVGGGEHYTGLPELSLTQSALDVAVLGEGEETIVALLRAYAAHVAAGGGPDDVAAFAADLPGVAFRTRGPDGAMTVQQNARRDRIKDVDHIALPAWDLFAVAAYDKRRLITGLRLGRTMPILATRGCPYRCAYCSSPNMWTTRWIPRDPKLVADEIQGYVEQFGANNFPFHDLTAILKRQWIVDFCNELIARDLKINWQLPSGTRCEVVDDEVASLLRRSGGLSLNFAPESGSATVRQKISKQMTEESLFRAASAAVKHGLNASVFFVLGFPGDTANDMRETARWAARLAKLGLDDVAVGFYFPIPGTRFYRELEARGRVALTDEIIMAPIFVHDRWLTEDRNFSETMSARSLSYWRYRIMLTFYLRAVIARPSRFLRVIRNFFDGREESKLDSALQILKERWFTRRAVREAAGP